MNFKRVGVRIFKIINKRNLRKQCRRLFSVGIDKRVVI